MGDTKKGSCGTCGFWNTQAYPLDAYREHGDGWGMCDRHSTRFNEQGPERMAEAISYGHAVDGEFMTRRDFSCICWDDKATAHLVTEDELPCPEAEAAHPDGVAGPVDEEA